jgi:hypothetical protein
VHHTANASGPPSRSTLLVSLSARGGIGHEHVAPAADHPVHAVVLEVHPLRVENAVLHVGQAARLAVAAGVLDHLRREVGADHPALGAHALRYGKAQVAGPAGDVEDGLARLRVRPVHEPGVHAGGHVHHPFPPVLPAGGHPAPCLQALLAVGVEVDRHALVSGSWTLGRR